MSWSKDQRPSHAHALAVSDAPESPTHSAKSLMDRRWEQRRAAANARWAEVTSTIVLERADISGVQPTGTAAPPPPPDLLLEDMRQLELKDRSKSSASYAVAPHGTGPMWLRNTQRAMLLVAAVSCSTLLALLYFGGFLG